MLLSKVRRTIEKYRMLSKGDKVIVAVSGGPDSVFLLHALIALQKDPGLSLVVAHLNHGIRGLEAERESRFVENLARDLKLPFELQSVDVPAMKKDLKTTTQQAARVARYDFFLATLEKYKAQKVVLGHNADDQAETVLMRLIRGAGTKGLCGIPPVRDDVFIRPLIEIERFEIEEFLREKKIEWILDSSNKEDIYLRNKIRHHLMPVIKDEYNPSVVQTLIHTSEILRHEDAYLEQLSVDFFSRACVSQDNEAIVLNLLYLQELEYAMQIRVVRKAIEAFCGDLQRIAFFHLESIMGLLARKSGNVYQTLPRGIYVEKKYNELIIRREMKETPFFYSFSQIPGSVRLQEIEREVVFEVTRAQKSLNFSISPDTAFLDYSKIELPIVIRSFREGDTFQPMGLKGTKKLKNFFIDKKIPRSERKRIPLLIFNDSIAWVMGLRIDQRVKVEEYTREILKVRIR